MYTINLLFEVPISNYKSGPQMCRHIVKAGYLSCARMRQKKIGEFLWFLWRGTVMEAC